MFRFSEGRGRRIMGAASLERLAADLVAQTRAFQRVCGPPGRILRFAPDFWLSTILVHRQPRKKLQSQTTTALRPRSCKVKAGGAGARDRCQPVHARLGSRVRAICEWPRIPSMQDKKHEAPANDQEGDTTTKRCKASKTVLIARFTSRLWIGKTEQRRFLMTGGL
jgi:hypothetical protein